MNRGIIRRALPALLLVSGLAAGSFAARLPAAQAQARPWAALSAVGLTSKTTIVQAGSTLQVSGFNFTAGEAVALSIDGGTNALAVVHASALGTLVARLAVPARLTSGLHLITATGLASHVRGYIAIVVTGGSAPAPVAAATTQASAVMMANVGIVARGSAVTLSLRNFAAGESVVLSFNNTATPLMVVHASSTGTAVVRLTISANVAPGLHTIVAVGTTSQHFALVAIRVV